MPAKGRERKAREVEVGVCVSLCLAEKLVTGAACSAGHQAFEGQVAPDVRVVLPLEKTQAEPLANVLLRGRVEHLVPHLLLCIRDRGTKILQQERATVSKKRLRSGLGYDPNTRERRRMKP